MASQPAPIPFAPAPVPGTNSPPQAVMPAPKKTAPAATPNKVVGAKIVLQYRDELGKIHEATTTIDPTEHIVESYTLTVEEKYEKAKDENGNVIGLEDSGIRNVNFKLRYHVRGS